jgi:serine-type D-Ala-D-Ala carboxypeptidase/endopeptidase
VTLGPVVKHIAVVTLIGSLHLFAQAHPARAQTAPSNALEDQLPALSALFEKAQQEAHIPGLVWGIVQNGKLVHVQPLGMQDVDTNAPVTADTAFRIASMTKAFTAYAILQLNVHGKLRLDDPVTRYIPETQSWAKGITIADLLHHSAGFVTDDPWGDRQQVRSEAEFTRMLRQGVVFSSAPRTRYEYSNFGYAMLGRIISNVSGRSYAAHITKTILQPLGMNASRFEVLNVPKARFAAGYRYENDIWKREPDMKDGAFNAMGGLVTTAHDYAKWMAHLLSGWPAQIGDAQQKTMIREMARGEGFLHMRRRPGKDADSCRLNAIYGHGLVAANDCTLGAVLFHGGGYPGYGSHMLLLPEAGVGIFALSNRTYAPAAPPVWDAATLLMQKKIIAARSLPVSAALSQSYQAAIDIWQTGHIEAAPGRLAMNMLMDRSADNWAAVLAKTKMEAGACNTEAALTPTGALSGRFTWACEKGSISGTLLLAPTATAQIQALNFQFAAK